MMPWACWVAISLSKASRRFTGIALVDQHCFGVAPGLSLMLAGPPAIGRQIPSSGWGWLRQRAVQAVSSSSCGMVGAWAVGRDMAGLQAGPGVAEAPHSLGWAWRQKGVAGFVVEFGPGT